jgi:hypothetical protein
MIPIIGFCGYAQVGKDLAFQLLERDFPHLNFRRLAVGDLIRKDVESCWNELVRRGHTMTTAEAKAKFRDMWVTWGATARSFDPRFFIDRLHPAVMELRNRQGRVVLTDMRKPIEIEWVHKELDGVVFKIERPGVGPANPTEREDMEEVDSKHNLSVIVNDGSPKDLADKLAHVLQTHFNISAEGAQCPLCFQFSRQPQKVCSKCGASVCGGCIIYRVPAGEFVCQRCR